MMLDFNYYASTYYEFGEEADNKVGKLVKKIQW